MIKPLIRNISGLVMCGLLLKLMRARTKVSILHVAKRTFFKEPTKESHLHMCTLTDPSHLVHSLPNTIKADQIESPQSRWAHADKLCDALPSVSKQTNGTLRFHESDYQNVKHLSLPMRVWKRSQHIEHWGGGADKKGEGGEIKAEQREGWGQMQEEMQESQKWRLRTRQEGKTSRENYFLTGNKMIEGIFRSHYLETDLVKAALVLRKMHLRCRTLTNSLTIYG